MVRRVTIERRFASGLINRDRGDSAKPRSGSLLCSALRRANWALGSLALATRAVELTLLAIA
jgi:hypothetical protein